MKKKLLLLFIGLLSLTLITSCDFGDDEEQESIGYATALKVEGNDIPTLIGDNGLTYIISNNSILKEYNLVTNDRLLLAFHLIKSDSITMTENIELTDLSKILTKNIVLTNEPNTLGTGKINIASAWISNNSPLLKTFLTIKFQFKYDYLYPTHKILLYRDTTNIDLPEFDNEDYLNLSLADSTNINNSGYLTYGIISVPIKEEWLIKMKGVNIYYPEIDSENTGNYSFKLK
ncbi:MAG: NigD-like C-terminal domain-containing protein [Bacteroidales bacterium]